MCLFSLKENHRKPFLIHPLYSSLFLSFFPSILPFLSVYPHLTPSVPPSIMAPCRSSGFHCLLVLLVLPAVRSSFPRSGGSDCGPGKAADCPGESPGPSRPVLHLRTPEDKGQRSHAASLFLLLDAADHVIQILLFFCCHDDPPRIKQGVCISMTTE